MRIAIGLGSSLGDRRRILERTLKQLDAHDGLELRRASRWYRTPPMRGGTATGWFLNGVAVFESRIDPWEILGVCRELEQRAGRRRSRYWGDRTLDLDVLVAEGFVSSDPGLTLPHPGIAVRRFVRIPLLEVWPDVVDEKTGCRLSSIESSEGPTPIAVGVVAGRRALP